MEIALRFFIVSHFSMFLLLFTAFEYFQIRLKFSNFWKLAKSVKEHKQKSKLYLLPRQVWQSQ